MKKIKFSHRYEKLRSMLDHVVLANVSVVELAELPEAFLSYDTRIEEGGQYELPKHGTYLLLLFVDINGNIFTTLRPAWPSSKIEYYQESIGETFEITFVQDQNL